MDVTQSTLCYYATHLANKGLAWSSIKTYLAAVRFLLISKDRIPPTASETGRLQLVLAGIQRVQALSKHPRLRLPITPPILHQLNSLWSQKATSYESIILWATCCVCFFGFFRLGELIPETPGAYNSDLHMRLADVAADNPAKPQVLSLYLKRAKTDQLGKGSMVYITRSDNWLCPVTALLAYIAARGQVAGALFILQDGTPLSKLYFIPRLRAALSSLGHSQGSYAGHSFRIGAATTAAAAGIEDSSIQALGRWSSAAFQSYIRLSPQERASLASRMTEVVKDKPHQEK